MHTMGLVAQSSASFESLDGSLFSTTSTPSQISSSRSTEFDIPLDRGGFYAAGSAIKGIGNIVISGISHVDLLYRRRRLRGLVKLMAWRERLQLAVDLSRLAVRIIQPRKQLHGLLDDVLEISSTSFEDVWYIGDCLSSNSIPMTVYMRLKWLYIWTRIYHPQHPMFYNQSPFASTYTSEEQATKHTYRRLQRMYWALPSDEGRGELALILGRTSTADGAYPIMRPETWRTANKLVVEMVNSSTSIVQCLLALNQIHLHDGAMEIDGDPDQGHSLWGEICSNLHSRAKIVDFRKELQIASATASIMRMLANLHAARHPSLRRTDILIPAVMSVPEEMWSTVAYFCVTCMYFPELGEALEPGVRAKELALHLAREL